MNFYYEIKLNFNDDKLFNFYEWSVDDKLDHIKKIPLIKVKSNVFRDIYSYNFKINEDFLEHEDYCVVTCNLNEEKWSDDY